MKKIFISQSMADMPEEKIQKERMNIADSIQHYLNEEVEIIDSFVDNAPKDASPLWFLGKSLEFLSEADICVFGEGWDSHRGCKMEHMACEQYGISIMYASDFCYINDNNYHNTPFAKTRLIRTILPVECE